MGKPVVISVLGDARGLNSTLDSSGGRLSKFGNIAKVGLLGLGAGLAVATGAAFKLAQAAAEDEQSAMLMAKQFRNSAKATDAQVAATERWITKQGIAKGVADDELRPALSNLVTATKDVNKAQSLANLAMDISAAKNISLVSASKQLAKAQATGNVAALSRLGVSMKDADGKAVSLEEAQRRLGAAFGGTAATKAKSFTGMMGRGKLMLSEFGESIGYKLLPPLTEFGTFLFTKGVPAISKFTGEMRERLTPTIAKISTGVRRFLPVVVGLAQSFLSGVVPAIGSFVSMVGAKVLPIVSSMVTIFTTQVLPTCSSIAQFFTTTFVPAVMQLGTQIGGSLMPVVNSLSQTFQTQILPTVSVLIAKFNEARPALQRVALVILKVVGFGLRLSAAILGRVLPPLIRLAGFLVGKVVPAAATVAVVIVNLVAKIINFGSKVIAAGGKAGQFAAKIISTIGALPGKLAGAVTALVGVGGNIIAGLAKGIRDKAGDVINTIKETIIDKLPGFVKKALGIKSPSRVFAKIGKNIVQGLDGGIKHEAPTIAKTMSRLSSDIATFSSGVTITPKVRTDFQTSASLRGSRGGAVINLYVEISPTANKAEIGREIAACLDDYFSIGGKRP